MSPSTRARFKRLSRVASLDDIAALGVSRRRALALAREMVAARVMRRVAPGLYATTDTVQGAVRAAEVAAVQEGRESPAERTAALVARLETVRGWPLTTRALAAALGFGSVAQGSRDIAALERGRHIVPVGREGTQRLWTAGPPPRRLSAGAARAIAAIGMNEVLSHAELRERLGSRHARLRRELMNAGLLHRAAPGVYTRDLDNPAPARPTRSRMTPLTRERLDRAAWPTGALDAARAWGVSPTVAQHYLQGLVLRGFVTKAGENLYERNDDD